MPLPKDMSKDIFTDIGNSVEPAEKPAQVEPAKELPKVEPVKQQESPPKKQAVRRPAKQAEGKVSCTFHLPESVRDSLQALAYVTRTPQNQLVEDAVHSLIKRKGITLPERAA